MLIIDSIDICGLQTDAYVYVIAFQLFDNEIFQNITINYCQTSGVAFEDIYEYDLSWVDKNILASLFFLLLQISHIKKICPIRKVTIEGIRIKIKKFN